MINMSTTYIISVVSTTRSSSAGFESIIFLIIHFSTFSTQHINIREIKHFQTFPHHQRDRGRDLSSSSTSAEMTGVLKGQYFTIDQFLITLNNNYELPWWCHTVTVCYHVTRIISGDIKCICFTADLLRVSGLY